MKYKKKKKRVHPIKDTLLEGYYFPFLLKSSPAPTTFLTAGV